MVTSANRQIHNAALTQPERVALNKVANVLDVHGQGDSAALLRAGTKRAAGRSTVVVAGQVKRGKSTLVNALSGQTVSPTGVDVVTFCPIWLVPPGPDKPVGTGLLLFDDGQAGAAMDVTKVLARLDPNDPSPDPRGAPIGAKVAVDQTYLQGLELVDTPGVGGLEAAHGRVTLAALGEAAALLFVTDSRQPLSRPELDFLRRASEDVSHVVFALTKIDHSRGWREVLEENRRHLREHAPRYAEAPYFPVAAALAEESFEAEPDDAEFLFESSRVAELAEGLRAAVADGDRIRAVEALHAGRDGLVAARESCERDLIALKDETAVAAMKTDRAALLAARKDLESRRKDAIRFDIPDAMGQLRAAALSQLEEGCREISRGFSAQLSASSWSIVPEAQFRASLQGELNAAAVRLWETMDGEMQQIVAQAFAGLPKRTLQMSDDTQSYAFSPRVAAGTVQRNAATGAAMEVASLPTGIFMAQRTAEWIAPLAATVLAPFGVVAMVPVFGMLIGAAPLVSKLLLGRRGRQEQQLRADLRESLDELKRKGTEAIRVVIQDFRRQLTRGLEDSLDSAAEELNDSIRAATASEKQRDTRRREIDQAVGSIAGTQTDLDGILRRLEHASEAAVLGSRGRVGTNQGRPTPTGATTGHGRRLTTFREG